MKLGSSTQNHWPESCPRLMSSKTEFQIQPYAYAFRVVSTVQAHMLYNSIESDSPGPRIEFFNLKLYALKLHFEYAISNGSYRIQMRVIALTLWLCELSAQSAQCVASMRCFFVVVLAQTKSVSALNWYGWHVKGEQFLLRTAFEKKNRTNKTDGSILLWALDGFASLWCA